MTTTIVEQELEVEFDDRWELVLKWDDTNAYREGIHRLQKSKAVDVLAYCSSKRMLLFVELKDFRKHRVENKSRISDAELFEEVGLKVRDTIAGVQGAARVGHDGVVAEMARRIVDSDQLRVVLWLEEDRAAAVVPRSVAAGRRKGRRVTMNQVLKRHLKWLTARTLVGSRSVSSLGDHGIAVRTLRVATD